MKKGRRIVQRLLTTLLCLALYAADIIPTGMTVLAQEQEAQTDQDETDTADKKEMVSEEAMEAEEPAEDEPPVKEEAEELTMPVEEERESVSENAVEENTTEKEQEPVSENTIEEEQGIYSVIAASEGEPIASGTSNNISWIINANGKLTVSGTGDFERKDGKYAPWYEDRESIVTAEINVENMADASYMFSDCQNLTYIYLYMFSGHYIDSVWMANMTDMFAGCTSLAELNINCLLTENVTDMSGMFKGCSELSELDITSFDTGNVTNMSSMFSGCSSLENLNLGNFDTSSVTDMSGMFSDCESLTYIYTPRNVGQSVELPGDKWYLSDGTMVTELPKNLNYSIALKKNIAPENIANGKSNDISWVIDVNGKLTVSGNGDFKRVYKPHPMSDSHYNTFLWVAPWIDYRNSIKTAEVDVTSMTNTSCMFVGCENLITLDVSKFDTSSVTDMSRMYDSCWNLTSLDLSNFNTSSVTNMSYMFSGCTSLTSLDVSSFDTSSVTNMSNMFSGCSNYLTSLDLSNFNTSSVTDMNSMFWCSGLTTLNVSSFDTSNVTDMSGMFWYCNRLTTLDLSNFDTGSVRDMEFMFLDCQNLSMIYTPRNVKQSVELPAKSGDIWYYDDTVVTELPKNLDYSITLKKHAADIASGTSGDVSWVIDANGKLTVTGTGNFERDMRAPWYKHGYSIKTAEIDVTDMTDASFMFYDCKGLTNINLKNFDTNKVTDMGGMFSGCTSLTTLDVSNFDTSNVTDMGGMFSGCTSLTELDVSNFNTSNVTNMFNMFGGCTSLTTLDVSNFDTSSVTNMANMFNGCISLTTLDVSNFDTSSVTDMYFMFCRCENLITLDLSNFNTGNVTDMDRMFSGCNNLTVLDLSSFDTSKVTDMHFMFEDCSNLATLHTPRNVKQIVELPAQPGDKWYRSDGTVVIGLPMNFGYSIVLERNRIPSDKKPDDDPENDNDDDVLNEDIPEDGVIPEGLWIAKIADYTYTGTAIKPEVHVYESRTRLKQGTDYTLSYKNNTMAAGAADAKLPTVVVQGKGNYSGTETKTFTIKKRDISDTYVTKSFTDAYTPLANGKNPTLVFSAKCNNKALKKNTDYTLTVKDSSGNEVPSYAAVGTYTAVVKGVGTNYAGEYSFPFEVLNKVPVTKLKIGKIASVNYDGTSKTPEPVIKYGKVTLNKEKDYTLNYQNNTAIGTATIEITGMGDYFGIRKVTFSITGLPIKQAKFTAFKKSFPYTGDNICQTTAVLKYGENDLVEGKDYTVSYSNCLNRGKAIVTYTGIGKYTGSLKKTYSITAYNIKTDAQKRIKLSTDTISAVYAKGGAKPSLKVYDGARLLTEGKDYTLSYQNNTAVTTSAAVKQPTITVKGMGNYAGTFSEKKTFTITAKDIAEVTVTVPDLVASTKTGKYKSTPILTDTDGKKLKAGTDYDKAYTYTYKNTTEKVLNNGAEVTRNAGDPVDAKDIVPANTVLCVRIKAKEGGNYTGETTAEYRIVISMINKAKITVKNPDQNNKNLFSYTGQAIRLDKSNLEVKFGRYMLSEDQYEILENTYKNNVGKGTASVQIRGVGNYGGTATVKFKIGTKNFHWVK